MRPLARLLLRSGIGFKEFAEISKESFVSVATREFGVRGRPTNISRVSAITGLSRKDVARVRTLSSLSGSSGAVEGWNSLSVILHHWHSDPEFSQSPGRPLRLPFASGTPSFADLVRKYGGDLPPGAVRAELRRAGVVTEDEEGFLAPQKHWYAPNQVDPAFLESMAFSLSNITETINHNIALASEGLLQGPSGRVERYVWTSGISESDQVAFKALSESRASALLEELDEWIAERERALAQSMTALEERPTEQEIIIGLGVYYFERPRRDDQ
jgi:hypothetical protein